MAHIMTMDQCFTNCMLVIARPGTNISWIIHAFVANPDGASCLLETFNVHSECGEQKQFVIPATLLPRFTL
jgi:hypothetical protein